MSCGPGGAREIGGRGSVVRARETTMRAGLLACRKRAIVCVCVCVLGKSGGQIRGSSIDPPQSAGTTADHTLRPHSGPASYDFGQANFMSALEGKDWPMHAAAQDDRYNIELGHPQRLRFDGTLPHNRHNDVAGIVSGICLRMPQLPSIAET